MEGITQSELYKNIEMQQEQMKELTKTIAKMFEIVQE